MLPHQPIALNEDYATHHAPVIDPGLAAGLRKERSQPLDLLVAQPKKLVHDPSPSREAVITPACTQPDLWVLTVDAEGSASVAESGGRVQTRHRKVPGLVGTMAGIIGTLDRYVGLGNTNDRFEVDLTTVSSGIWLRKKLEFDAKAIEMKAKPGSPDVQLDIGGVKSSLTIAVTGKLDFIDALAMALAGRAARVIRDARARMAAGKSVNAVLEAFLELSASGQLAHEINEAASITIPASGDFSAGVNALSQTFGGEIRIFGQAAIRIEVNAEVWVFRAAAGLSGAIHTSWTWKMRMQGEQRQKSYIFDGFVLTYVAHVGASIQTEDNGVGEDIINLEAGDREGSMIQVFRGEETAWEDY